MANLTVPDGARDRLIEHYGPDVVRWLSGVEAVFAAAADRWGVTIHGFHDSGWTSVVAVGRGGSGRALILKAFPERDRYLREREALRQWSDGPVCRLLRVDDTDQILLLEAVAGVPGGASRPGDHTKRVAERLPRLHEADAASGSVVPLLTVYHRTSVIPRIRHRAERFGNQLSQRAIKRAIAVCDGLCRLASRPVMLHSDLYAENVLFDNAGEPVFIDPHAKVGSPAFDWAFWCVYYLPFKGFSERAGLCHEIVPELYDEMLAWALTLVVDGGLYYLVVGDERSGYMRSLLRSDELAPLLR